MGSNRKEKKKKLPKKRRKSFLGDKKGVGATHHEQLVIQTGLEWFGRWLARRSAIKNPIKKSNPDDGQAQSHHTDAHVDNNKTEKKRKKRKNIKFRFGHAVGTTSTIGSIRTNGQDVREIRRGGNQVEEEKNKTKQKKPKKSQMKFRMARHELNDNETRDKHSSDGLNGEIKSNEFIPVCRLERSWPRLFFFSST